MQSTSSIQVTWIREMKQIIVFVVSAACLATIFILIMRTLFPSVHIGEYATIVTMFSLLFSLISVKLIIKAKE